MAIFDTRTKRMGMLGWGVGDMLPTGHAVFDDTDAQLYLGLPGQYQIENGAPPEPEPEPEGSGMGSRRKTGIGPR